MLYYDCAGIRWLFMDSGVQKKEQLDSWSVRLYIRAYELIATPQILSGCLIPWLDNLTEGKLFCVQWVLRYGDLCSDLALKIEPANFVTFTWRSVSLSGDDPDRIYAMLAWHIYLSFQSVACLMIWKEVLCNVHKVTVSGVFIVWLTSLCTYQQDWQVVFCVRVLRNMIYWGCTNQMVCTATRKESRGTSGVNSET